MIIRIILYILAAVSFWYSFMIYRVNSGTMFYMVWTLLGIVLLGFGIALKTGLFKKFPMWLNIGFASVAGIFAIVFTVILVIIISYGENRTEKGLDYIIVLGGQVRPEGPSKVLRYRLDTAEKYLKENPETICIVSGGKGTNEISSEAEAMKKYLTEKGIDPGRIIMEDKSTITDENIRFSKEFIPEKATVGVVTNDFHLYRAIYLCEKNGLKDVCPIRADSDLFYRPNNYCREVFAFIKDSLLS